MTIKIFNSKRYRSLSGPALFAAGYFIACGWAGATETASATFTDSQVSPGIWQYQLNLTDTGTTTVGTFWFAWTPGDNFMLATPTSITSPAGWGDAVTTGGPSGGSAIMWQANSAADDLTAGSPQRRIWLRKYVVTCTTGSHVPRKPATRR